LGTFCRAYREIGVNTEVGTFLRTSSVLETQIKADFQIFGNERKKILDPLSLPLERDRIRERKTKRKEEERRREKNRREKREERREKRREEKRREEKREERREKREERREKRYRPSRCELGKMPLDKEIRSFMGRSYEFFLPVPYFPVCLFVKEFLVSFSLFSFPALLFSSLLFLSFVSSLSFPFKTKTTYSNRLRNNKYRTKRFQEFQQQHQKKQKQQQTTTFVVHSLQATMTHLSPFSYPQRLSIVGTAFLMMIMLNVAFDYPYRHHMIHKRDLKFWCTTLLGIHAVTWMMYDFTATINVYYLSNITGIGLGLASNVTFERVKYFCDGLLDVTFTSHTTMLFLLISFWHTIFKTETAKR